MRILEKHVKNFFFHCLRFQGYFFTYVSWLGDMKTANDLLKNHKIKTISLFTEAQQNLKKRIINFFNEIPPHFDEQKEL
jgi:hypothetical protein